MTLEHPRHLDHRPQSASHGRRYHRLKKRLALVEQTCRQNQRNRSVIPQALAVFRPCFLIALKRRRCLGERFALLKSQSLTGAFEPVVVLGLKGLVFGRSHLIDRLPKMLGDVELVVHQFGVRRLPSDGLGIGREHVGGDGTYALSLFGRERREDAFGGRLRTFRSDIEDAGAVEIGEDGHAVLPSSEALLVDAKVLDGRGLAAIEAACHGAVHDRLRCIPGEAEQRCRHFHRTASLKLFDREGLEEKREARVLRGP